MDTKKTRKYTQKTIEIDSTISSGEHGEATKAKANASVETGEEAPISVGTLRAGLKPYEDSLDSIKNQLACMHKGISSDISVLREEAKADIKATRDELMGKVEQLFTMQAEAASTQKEMEKSLSDTTDRLTTLEKSYMSLKADYKKLQEKCTDLEDRSRRQNIRIVGVAEGAESNNITGFAAKFLAEVLGADNFDSPIVIDRAHRSLISKPRSGERPRPIIVRLHYFTEKEKILRLSRNKGNLHFDGSPVYIFPDISPEVGRMRATFSQLKQKLRSANIQYSLYYPAKLVITANGSRYTFTDAQAAEKFILSNKLITSEDETE